MKRYMGIITLETIEEVEAEDRQSAEEELQKIVDRDYPHETSLDDIIEGEEI